MLGTEDTHVQSTHRWSRFRRQEIIITVWVILLAAADLKSLINPYIHWIVSMIVFVLLIPVLARRALKVDSLVLIGILFLVVGILLSSFAADPLYGLVEAVKLVVILIGGLIVLGIDRNGLAAYRGLIISVYINIAFIILGLTISRVFASMMAAGRWGTLIAYPGSLWRVGISVFIYSIYRLFEGRVTIWSVCLSILSIACVILDGTRTGILLLVVGLVYLFIVFAYERRAKRLFMVSLFVASLLLGYLLMFLPVTSTPATVADQDKSGLQRVSALIDSVSQHGISAGDPIRFRMIQKAVAQVEDHPLVGSGIGTTKAETPTGPMVVHMTYLQIWADLGIFGLLGYLIVVLGWIYTVSRTLSYVRKSTDAEYKAYLYNSVFLLFAFVITGLFHPLSTEWSEWIPFLIAFTFVKKSGQKVQVVRK